MGSIGAAELLVLFVVIALLGIFLWAVWRILSRMGFPGALGLVSLIPGGAIVLVLVLAFIEWPIERERPGAPAARRL